MNYHFREREAQLYLKKYEMTRLLSPIDKIALAAIGDGESLNGPAIRKRTGLSKMALLLAGYRLVGLGLITQRAPRRKRSAK